MHGTVQPGDLLDGKYAVERLVGQGGAAYVVAAQHVRLCRRVALKVLRPHLATDAELCSRFLREGQAAARMKGDHVARVMDAGTLLTGQPYLVMEYLEGEDLAAVVRRRGHVSVTEAADFLLQACEAVSEAHALRIIHRDLKPANLFLTTGSDGTPFIKVLDFGLSKVLDREAPTDSSTDSNHVMGSPHFMSPEQIRTPRDVDERTDVWSLGATLFTLLTGHVPFEGRSLIEVCGALLCGPPPRMARFRSDVPDDLEAIVLGCLRIEPRDRYPSLLALARELSRFAPPTAGASIQRIPAMTTDPGAPGPMRPVAPPSVDARRVEPLPGAALPFAGVLAILPRGARTKSARVVVGGCVLALIALASRLPRPARTASSARVSEAETGPTPRAGVVAEPAGEPMARGPEPQIRADVSVVPPRDYPRPLIRAEGGPRWGVATLRVPPPLPPTSMPPAKPSAPPPLPDCAQPFYIDVRGIKAIRRECM